MVRILLLFSVLIPFTIQAAQWQLMWADEFDYQGLPDQSRWGYDVGGSGWGNEELQYYTSERSENARVENGYLLITARKEVYGTNNYTSARLVTKNKGDWQYCRVEVRAKLPRGNGTWPAIWMLPTTNAYGGWPSSGEIDIMEAVGYDTNRVFCTVHTAAYNHKIGTQRGGNRKISDAYDQFNIYAMEWCEDSVLFFVNDARVFAFGKETSAGFDKWPFDQNFHLLLNIAVGGAWGGVQGVDENVFPQQMVVDYVRVYEKLQDQDCLLTMNTLGSGSVIQVPSAAIYTPGSSVMLTAQPYEGWVFRTWAGDISGSENPRELLMTRDRNITAVFVRKGELVYNGEFSLSMEGWNVLGAYEGAVAKAVVDENGCRVEVSASGHSDWTVQLTQSGIPLTAGAGYTLSFDAWTDNPGPQLTAGVNMDKAPWTPYHKGSFLLSSTPQTFIYKFTKASPGDDSARVEFDLGLFTGNVYIDNISLTRDDFLTPVSGRFKGVRFQSKSEVKFFDLRGRQYPSVEKRMRVSGVLLKVKDGQILRVPVLE